MCGIVGAAAQRDVTPILVEGLNRLEYRGYDSAGVALIEEHASEHAIGRVRVKGRIAALSEAISASPVVGNTGIAHTRWATHGVPSEENAHPHTSKHGASEDIALVHNGIIENYLDIKPKLVDAGYEFVSETDTEVVAHLLHLHYQASNDLFAALQKTVAELRGAYSLAVVHRDEPGRVVGARSGSPLVIGVGIGEHFLASDTYALMPVTNQFAYLEEGDLVDIRTTEFHIVDQHGNAAERPVVESAQDGDLVGKGEFRHFMLKEIHEQPAVLAETLEGRIYGDELLTASFSDELKNALTHVEHCHIVACGTSYLAGSVARFWLEKIGIATSVEVASEYRYRDVAVPKNTLFLTLSQSGETADVMAALTKATELDYLLRLTICNVPDSSIVRKSDDALLTRAGREISVASTKAFTTQQATLLLLTLLIEASKGNKPASDVVTLLKTLPRLVEQTLDCDDHIEQIAKTLIHAPSMIYLGRRELYPIAMEGALKLKELSYIHAEAFASGELKHGPLALIDDEMPVIAVVQSDDISEKVVSNLQEVSARGGRLIVIRDEHVDLGGLTLEHDIVIPHSAPEIAPIVFSIPMQLLAYRVAVAKGTDVDKPRNLAKSVTVE